MPGPVFNFELAFDTTFYSISAALNIGYRLRNKGEPVSGPIEPLGKPDHCFRRIKLLILIN